MKNRFSIKEINEALDLVKKGKNNGFKTVIKGKNEFYYFKSTSFIIRSSSYISIVLNGKMVFQAPHFEENQRIILPGELAEKFNSFNKINIFEAPRKAV